MAPSTPAPARDSRVTQCGAALRSQNAEGTSLRRRAGPQPRAGRPCSAGCGGRRGAWRGSSGPSRAWPPGRSCTNPAAPRAPRPPLLAPAPAQPAWPGRSALPMSQGAMPGDWEVRPPRGRGWGWRAPRWQRGVPRAWLPSPADAHPRGGGPPGTPRASVPSIPPSLLPRRCWRRRAWPLATRPDPRPAHASRETGGPASTPRVSEPGLHASWARRCGESAVGWGPAAPILARPLPCGANRGQRSRSAPSARGRSAPTRVIMRLSSPCGRGSAAMGPTWWVRRVSRRGISQRRSRAHSFAAAVIRVLRHAAMAAAEKRPVVLHLDLNRTVLMSDAAAGRDVRDTLNYIVADSVWGHTVSDAEGKARGWSPASDRVQDTAPEEGMDSYLDYLSARFRYASSQADVPDTFSGGVAEYNKCGLARPHRRPRPPQSRRSTPAPGLSGPTSGTSKRASLTRTSLATPLPPRSTAWKPPSSCRRRRPTPWPPRRVPAAPPPAPPSWCGSHTGALILCSFPLSRTVR